VLNVTGKARVFRPAVKFLPSGKAVCEFALGVSKKQKDGTYKNSFHNAKAFGPIAEQLAEMDKKDVMVEGFLAQDEWEKDGKKQRKDYVVVMKVLEVVKEATTDEDIPF
jgi:single-stranded DNA-binding protein